MKRLIATTIRPVLHRFGLDVVRYHTEASKKVVYPLDFSSYNIEICEAVKSYTMTGPERVNALVDATQYVVANRIPGAMVECGVWKGGSTMAMALILKKLGCDQKDIYLYDTFAGMTAPGDADVSIVGTKAQDTFSKTKLTEDSSDWCLSPLDEVSENVLSTGYPKERIHFIKGKVEETIPGNMPDKIALLRLDTDWYSSTKHELTHLFPLLQPNGVLIIDDYGHWEGARKAVDEYFAERQISILLNRIDGTGRIAIKT